MSFETTFSDSSRIGTGSTNKKPTGFFPNIYESIVQSLSKQDFKAIEDLSNTEEAIIKYVSQLEKFNEVVAVRECYTAKNHAKSKLMRQKGMEAYKKQKDLEALHYFNECVISAPAPVATKSKKGELSTTSGSEGEDLWTGLANRSAVLFSLKVFDSALDDIELALRSGYPSKLRHKLIDRRLKIHLAQQQFQKAANDSLDLLEALKISNLKDGEKKKKMEPLFNLNQVNIKLLKDNKMNKQVNDDEELKVKTPGEMYPALSDQIKIKYEENCGRFAIATNKVNVGEFVCVESPIVSRILPEYSPSNCSHCFVTLKAPIPCPTCCNAMFCSLDCREKALNSYHKYECKLIDFLVASGMSIACFLAFRAITQKPSTFFINELKLDEPSNDELYKTDDYINLLNLVTHERERKFSDNFHRAMFTTLLIKCLRHQGYFGSHLSSSKSSVVVAKGLTSDEMKVALILNKLLQIAQFNSHEVAQFEMISADSDTAAESKFIGAAIYPSLALFNHSCDPSIIRYYIKDKVYVQAIKNIFKGEEVCENYGPIFFHSPKDDRQNRLKSQYWFDCQCIACVENWPLMHDLENVTDTLRFRCSKCHKAVVFSSENDILNPWVACDSCQTPVPMMQVLKEMGDKEAIYTRAKELLGEMKLKEAQKLLCEYLTFLDTALVPPYSDYYKIQQQIWKCIWMRHGNRVIRSAASNFVSTSSSSSGGHNNELYSSPFDDIVD